MEDLCTKKKKLFAVSNFRTETSRCYHRRSEHSRKYLEDGRLLETSKAEGNDEAAATDISISFNNWNIGSSHLHYRRLKSP